MTPAAAASRAAARAFRPAPMRLRVLPSLISLLLLLDGKSLCAQQEVPPEPPVLDIIFVEGNTRNTTQQILGNAGLAIGHVVGFRYVQRDISAHFRTGH